MDPEEGGGERGGKKEGGKGDEGPFGVTRGTSGVGLVQYVFQFRQKMVAVLYSKRSIHKKSCVYASAGITITYDFCWTCSINRIHHTVARAFTHPTNPKKNFATVKPERTRPRSQRMRPSRTGTVLYLRNGVFSEN